MSKEDGSLTSYSITKLFADQLDCTAYGHKYFEYNAYFIRNIPSTNKHIYPWSLTIKKVFKLMNVIQLYLVYGVGSSVYIRQTE